LVEAVDEGRQIDGIPEIHVLDALLVNWDRNFNNWIVRPGGHAVAIDHGNLSEYRGLSWLADHNLPNGEVLEKLKSLTDAELIEKLSPWMESPEAMSGLLNRRRRLVEWAQAPKCVQECRSDGHIVPEKAELPASPAVPALTRADFEQLVGNALNQRDESARAELLAKISSVFEENESLRAEVYASERLFRNFSKLVLRNTRSFPPKRLREVTRIYMSCEDRLADSAKPR
jgi:hypothetical protein